MRPISLHLENVRTFDTLDFTFAPGATALTGANGTGKSSLVSAVDLALFAAKGELADWLSKDRPEATMTILLVFEHGGETYRARRTYSGKGRGTTKVDFEKKLWGIDTPEVWTETIWHPLTRESASATQDELERIIGLNRQVFRMSAYFGQKDRSLCDLQPREAKQVLFDTLGLDVWDGYRERARVELRAAEQSLAIVRSKIEAAESELDGREAIESQQSEAVTRERQARAALEECGSQLVKARERLSALREAAGLREAAERARGAAERSHASLLDRIASLEQQIREAEGRLAEREGLEALSEALPDLVRERDALAEQERGFAECGRLAAEHARLMKESEDLRARYSALYEKIAAVLRGVGAETCDRCGQTLHADAAQRAVESYTAEADEISFRANNIEEYELVRLNEQISALPAAPADRERLAHVHDLIQQGQNAQQRLAALAEVEASRARAAEEFQQVRAKLPERENAVAAARAELDALGPHDAVELKVAEDKAVYAQLAEDDARSALDQIRQEIARLDERLQRLDRLNQENQEFKENQESLESEVELLSHLERACGPNGVPALILETSAIPQLEAEWNRLLRLLPTDSGDLFEVELHTQRERKAGGAVDALDVVVYANGHARPYSTYSGGEQMRISIAQRRALSNLLAHRRGADCPLMILDEPNSLDDAGMAALAQVLEDLAAAEGLTILVVSHDPALRDAFEQSVTVSKVDGRSWVEPTDGAVSISEMNAAQEREAVSSTREKD